MKVHSAKEIQSHVKLYNQQQVAHYILLLTLLFLQKNQIKIYNLESKRLNFPRLKEKMKYSFIFFCPS